jgi:hypothetical protein
MSLQIETQSFQFNNTVTGLSSAVFKSVSGVSLSGTFYGDGSKLSGISGNNYNGSDIKALTGNWQTTYTTVCANSANWNSSYTTLSTNSASWVTYSKLNTGSFVKYTDISSVTANWNSSYTTLTANSANWYTTYTTVCANSANWQTAYTNPIYTINGTLNQITVTTTGNNTGSNSATISLPDSVSITTLNVLSTLNISGSATYINTNNLVVGDNMIYFAAANPANSLDIGIVGHFTQAPLGYNHSGLIRRASQGTPGVWTLFSGLTSEPLSANNIDWADKNIVIDSLSANLIGNVTGNASTVTNGVYTTDTSTVTNTMLAGSIADNKITSSTNWNNTSTAYQTNSGSYISKTLALAYSIAL